VPKLFRAAAAAGVAVMVVLRGEPGAAVYVAEAVGRMLGYEPGELASTPLDALLPVAVRGALAGRRSEVRDARLRRKDGSELRVRIAKEAGEGELDVYALREAPPLDPAMDAVEGANAEFNRLLDAAPDGVIAVGARGLLYANPVLLRWFDEADTQSLGARRMEELIHTHDLRSAIETIQAVLAEPSIRRVARLRLRRARGGLFDAECVALGTRWAGEVACLVVVRDLSQRRLSQSRTIAADRRASVGTMSAGVAHEINNPLAYLLLNLEYLIRELSAVPEDGSKQAHFVERLAESRHGAERVGQILKELGSLSSRRRGVRQGVDLPMVVRRAIKAVDREVSQRARIRLDDRGAPFVDADPNSVEQLFVNLLSNAAHAFATPNLEKNVIRVRVMTADDGSALVEVSDNGTGIAPENLSRIFDPFFTTKATGTGLGLPISHAIATSFGGHIRVETELGVGSTFRVSLPPGIAAPARSKRPSSLPAPSARRARVLVVDDDPPVAETLGRVLSESYDVELRTSARQALELLTVDSEFDVILCDLLMPDMSGMDLHAELATREPGLERRLVFMTGGAFTARARDFLQKVKNAVLEKPFDFELLHAIVAERLGS
jgi:signal transduction histidine kinase/CheY-like chemotaxis protein